MKRILSSICVCSMVFAVTACGSQGSVSDPDMTAPITVPAFSQETDKEIWQTEPPQNISGESASVMEETDKEGGSDILVAYFSVTGIIETLARYISEVTREGLYEIVPRVLYSSEDLNYSDNNSWSTKEQNDKGVHPVTSGNVEDMDRHETIFLDYPIWWEEAPRVISTLMKSYDFSGKAIALLCTSGGSGIGPNARNLHNLAAPDVTWLDEERLSNNTSHEEMVSWTDGLSLDGIVR